MKTYKTKGLTRKIVQNERDNKKKYERADKETNKERKDRKETHYRKLIRKCS